MVLIFDFALTYRVFRWDQLSPLSQQIRFYPLLSTSCPAEPTQAFLAGGLRPPPPPPPPLTKGVFCVFFWLALLFFCVLVFFSSGWGGGGGLRSRILCIRGFEPSESFRAQASFSSAQWLAC